MPLPLGTTRDLVKELPRVGVLAVALLAALAFEHFVVHELILLPEQLLTGETPLWVLAAMVVPELVVCFAIGYRIRVALAAPMYAAIGGLVRGVFHHVLALTGQVGHTDPSLRSVSHLCLATGSMALAYLLVVALAAAGAAEQRQLVAGR